MLDDRTTAAPWPPAYPEGYAVVDVETTGLARDDRIISAAVYRLDARGEMEDHWYTLVNPQRDPGPVWIHGLTSDVLEAAPLFPAVAGELAARLEGRVLVAHNAVFDWSMIAREYARADLVAPTRQRLCTIALSKELGLPLANHKLETLAAHFGVVQRHAHHALDDARVLAEAFRPSLHAAAGRGVRLPLLECRPLTEWSDAPLRPRAGQVSHYRGSWRASRRLPPSPFPNPGRYEAGGPLVQGMRVAFSGDTSVDRELLEDRAVEAGLHVAGSVSRLTSLLVTNDPGAATSKVAKAASFGTPVVDEAAFTQLLRDVAPAPGGTTPGAQGPARNTARGAAQAELPREASAPVNGSGTALRSARPPAPRRPVGEVREVPTLPFDLPVPSAGGPGPVSGPAGEDG